MALGNPSQEKRRFSSKKASLESAWQQFDAMFKTELDCIEELWKSILKDEGIRCFNCGNLRLERDYGSRQIKCSACKRRSWFTAGTLFNRARLIRPWLAAIWLLEQGIEINAFILHNLVDIAYSTAWTIMKKLSMVLDNQMTAEALAVPSSVFVIVFSRRSRETPAGEHPRAEQQKFDSQLCQQSKL